MEDGLQTTIAAYPSYSVLCCHLQLYAIVLTQGPSMVLTSYFYCRFPSECNSGRILKIGQYLAKSVSWFFRLTVLTIRTYRRMQDFAIDGFTPSSPFPSFLYPPIPSIPPFLSPSLGLPLNPVRGIGKCCKLLIHISVHFEVKRTYFYWQLLYKHACSTTHFLFWKLLVFVQTCIVRQWLIPQRRNLSEGEHKSWRDACRFSLRRYYCAVMSFCHSVKCTI